MADCIKTRATSVRFQGKGPACRSCDLLSSVGFQQGDCYDFSLNQRQVDALAAVRSLLTTFKDARRRSRYALENRRQTRIIASVLRLGASRDNEAQDFACLAWLRIHTDHQKTKSAGETSREAESRRRAPPGSASRRGTERTAVLAIYERPATAQTPSSDQRLDASEARGRSLTAQAAKVTALGT